MYDKLINITLTLAIIYKIPMPCDDSLYEMKRTAYIQGLYIGIIYRDNIQDYIQGLYTGIIYRDYI